MVYLLLADGFETMEALVPLDVLRRAKVPVLTVAIGDELTVRSAQGVSVAADIMAGEVSLTELEMVVLPGGQPGTDHLLASDKVGRMVTFAHQNGQYLAAICAAPIVLGHWGCLTGERATCFPGYEADLTGAEVVGDGVVQSGRVITARGAGVALQFALALVATLRGQETADAISAQMQC